MEIRLSSHGAYHHKYHIVWIPKYRKKILEGQLKDFIEKRLFDIQEYHPDIEIEQYSIQKDHIHFSTVEMKTGIRVFIAATCIGYDDTKNRIDIDGCRLFRRMPAGANRSSSGRKVGRRGRAVWYG